MCTPESNAIFCVNCNKKKEKKMSHSSFSSSPAPTSPTLVCVLVLSASLTSCAHLIRTLTTLYRNCWFTPLCF